MNPNAIDSIIKDAATSSGYRILIVSAIHAQRRNTFSEFLDRLETVQDPNPFDDAIEAVIPPILIRFVNDSWIKFDVQQSGMPLGAGAEITSFVTDEDVELTSQELEQLITRMR